MTASKRVTKRAPLAHAARRRIRNLQTELKSGAGQAERKVRELERAQLFYSVVCRLGSDDAVMPEIARAQVRL
jgi:hypothetical protein